MSGMKSLLGDTPYSLEIARSRRDVGMARAVDHADRKEPAWRETAYDFLAAFARANQDFISEDVSDATKDTSFPQPPTDRAWGSVYRRALKAGIIKQHGAGRSRRRHASICPLWRSLVFDGRAA